jgi:transposase InsO family protein
VPCPGDLLQMDTKRLARFTRPGDRVTGDRTSQEKASGVGWVFCHSIIDDHTRLVYTEIHPDETSPTVTAFTTTALAFFADHRITAERLQTDNAWEYVRNRSLAELLTDRGIQHRRIPPRTPKRNGKLERYQQTLAREWAHGQRYRDSDPRGGAPDLARLLQPHPQPQLTLKPATHHPRSERPKAQHLDGRSLELLHLLLAQLDLECLEVLLEVFDRACARNRQHDRGVVQQPCESDLRRRRVVRASGLVQWAARTREISCCQREPRQKREPLSLAHAEHIFGLPIGKVVAILD